MITVGEKTEQGRNFGIESEGLPEHIAIIMDGNGRWAKRHNHSRIFGHQRGVRTVDKIVELASDLNIRALTLYAFSIQNWQRPKHEVHALMQLLVRYLKKKNRDLMKNNIRFRVSGNVANLPAPVQKTVKDTMEKTRHNTGLTLNLALNYGGREEIVRAARCIAEDLKEGKIDSKDIDEGLFSSYLYTRGLPEVDLLIRTSGERRVSNFLLWQIAYTEIYITPVLWPDFTGEDLMEAIRDYQARDRRFGAIKNS